MHDEFDPYWKLRPASPTPDDELCACADSPPIMLQAHLSANPISCIACNLEVPPERVGFSEDIAEELAFWQRFHDCFYFLWLDSGEFEPWAKAQLGNPTSAVNKRGLELVVKLNAIRPAYYWWFQDSGSVDFQPLLECPICQTKLVPNHGRQVCKACSIVVTN